MNVLVTGGAGYIGSHTILQLESEGYHTIIFDNFSNSMEEVINRIEKLTNKKQDYFIGDIRNKDDIKKAFLEYKIDAVIHLAGLKCIAESIRTPLCYYKTNVLGTINLLEVMEEFKVYTMIFSSSATVYGSPYTNPISEDFPLCATSPYGRSKIMIENILKDLYKSSKKWRFVILRFFNPIGAHESGLIGESPKNKPTNLVPYISRVAIGEEEYLHIKGSDYNTVDGTGVRDFVHVMDIAYGHVLAMNKVKSNPGLNIYNLGTGRGYSVLEVVKAYEIASNREIPYKMEERRLGDVDISYADITLAQNELGFAPRYSLEDMCKSSYNFIAKNLNGYKS